MSLCNRDDANKKDEAAKVVKKLYDKLKIELNAKVVRRREFGIAIKSQKLH